MRNVCNCSAVHVAISGYCARTSLDFGGFTVRFFFAGFTSTDEANDALQEALRQRKQNEKFGNKVPTVGVYA
ncbi:MAG: hypothetical protein U1E32_13030, partial [Rhodoglobus sp.]|nr:hypothetical protein [Rhodoglobus sp.]